MNVRASAYKYGLANGLTAPLITASADADADASADAVFSRQIASASNSQNNSMLEDTPPQTVFPLAFSTRFHDFFFHPSDV